MIRFSVIPPIPSIFASDVFNLEGMALFDQRKSFGHWKKIGKHSLPLEKKNGSIYEILIRRGVPCIGLFRPIRLFGTNHSFPLLSIGIDLL